MALFSITIRSAPDQPAAIKISRSLTSMSVAALRAAIGTDQPLLTIDTARHSLEVDCDTGHREQHARIRAVIDQLQAIGCEITLLSTVLSR